MGRKKDVIYQSQHTDTIKLTALSSKQKDYFAALRSSPLVIAIGPAGVGKSYCSTLYAAKLYKEKKINKIIITRPNIPTGKSIGYFPGSLEDKMAPWTAPIIEILITVLGKGVVETAIKNNNIELIPLETIRGRNFNDAFIILDEAQNTTYDEIKAFVTRIGKNSTMVIDGDISQTDLKEKSGLGIFLKVIQNLNIPVIEFDVDDIVRSDICKQLIIAFIDWESS
jgi:phosphate starvation-inducible PhoH-like protein